MLNTRVTQFIVWLLICLINVPPNTLATVKTYDFAGRLTRVEQRDAADTVVWAENHLYNERGRLRKKETTTGVLTYAYDAADRLESISTSRGTATAYAYDADNPLRDSGHRSQLQETINGAARTTDWTYDILYRLTGETVNNTATVSYTYDKVGNRQSRTGSGSGGTGVPPVGLYAYDLNDRLLSADTRNYTYDANGNTLTGHAHTAGINHLTGLSLTAQTVTDTYDHANRLIKRTAPGQTITILYDADGNRVAKTINGATTYYLVDTSNPTGYAQVIEEIKDGVVQKRYNYGLDLISQQHRQGNGTYQTRYYSHDGLGSTRHLTDDTGAITDRYTYDGYGTLIDKWSVSTVTDNTYLYAGEQYDPDLGLYYNRARYLNTDLGRFWTMDGFEGVNAEPLSLHKYLYAHSNPTNGTDPSGYFTLNSLNLIQYLCVIIAANSMTQATIASAQTIGFTIVINAILLQAIIDVALNPSKNPTGSRYAYEHGKCEEFANQAMSYFRTRNQSPKRIIYTSFSGKTVANLIAAYPGFGFFGGQMIANNGFHQGVLAGGLVYDNNVPHGVPRLAWEAGYFVHAKLGVDGNAISEINLRVANELGVGKIYESLN